jgi:hypothetical protein
MGLCMCVYMYATERFGSPIHQSDRMGLPRFNNYVCKHSWMQASMHVCASLMQVSKLILDIYALRSLFFFLLGKEIH